MNEYINYYLTNAIKIIVCAFSPSERDFNFGCKLINRNFSYILNVLKLQFYYT